MKYIDIPLVDQVILDDLNRTFREKMVAVSGNHPDETMVKIVYSQLYVNIKAILDHGPEEIDFLTVVGTILATANKAFKDSGADKLVDIDEVKIH